MARTTGSSAESATEAPGLPDAPSSPKKLLALAGAVGATFFLMLALGMIRLRTHLFSKLLTVEPSRRETPAGIFARLAAQVALGGLAPVTLLGLLKHPLLRLGASDNARAVAVLERAVLRGPRPRFGSAGLLGEIALEGLLAERVSARSTLVS